MSNEQKAVIFAKVLFQIEVEVKEDQIKRLLGNAFNGLSNYWIDSVDWDIPGYVRQDFIAGGKFNQLPDYWHPRQIIPLVNGCALLIRSNDLEKDQPLRRLDRAAIQKGLQLMAEKRLKHFEDIMRENEDETTGDVFLQMCLFGDVVYG
jgi:hypothetical protein